MRNINVETWNRKKIYEWFKSFSNSCFGVTNEVDITSLITYTKESGTSFFINILYIVVKTLNEFECMRMRFVNGEPVIYENCNPAYTVMTKNQVFENVRHEYNSDYSAFYSMAREYIEKAKSQMNCEGDDYNPKDCYNEYYITCMPWISFVDLSHPIPDDKGSQSIPRLCWGKFFQRDGKYIINLNVTVSHMFCDGYDIAAFFLKLQENIDNLEIN